MNVKQRARVWVSVLALIAWTAGQLGAEAPRTVHVLDARYLRGLDLSQPEKAVEVWDKMHALAALQGIVNRDAPRFYLLYCAEFGVETDQFWLDWLRGEDGWLRQTEVVPLASLEQAVVTFRKYVKGLAVYDPGVPATACLASTAAGCGDLLPVRFSADPNSVFALLAGRLHLPVKLWLLNPDGTSKFTGRGMIPDSNKPTSGSAKVDAYRWAVRRFIESGKCDARFAAYYLDAFWLQRPRNGAPDLHTLSNHDYFIARRGFFFDLSPWGDEPPVDDPNQAAGMDQQTMLRILRALHDRVPDRMIKIGGFPPWPYKYTTHGRAGKHDGVPTEWEFTRLISQFNAYHEADAAGPGAMANASYFAHYPLKARYPQPNRKPVRKDWLAAGFVGADGKVAAKLFVGHYVGDYDSPSWLYKAVPAFFEDPQRGNVPLGWAFDPNLADRAPQALAYAYRHATPNDFFIAGDSGAGYLNPRGLTLRPDSKLPSGLKSWQEHCLLQFRRWDMSITGFVLDGASGAATETEFAAYRSFSPDGCGTHFEKAPRMISGLPTCPERDLPDSAGEAAAVIAKLAGDVGSDARFLWARSILKSPAWYAKVSQILRDQHPEAPVLVVDPYTFFGLIRTQSGAE
ncbi:MAG: hypothetical protein K9N23_07580 [Akkermansiaceae bacterium]|nr:hypothetical protein [Akkermansiaceae bacterium]MCF7731531.1 hypothetical protein [Akkermansiaceae bacterium]